MGHHQIYRTTCESQALVNFIQMTVSAFWHICHTCPLVQRFHFHTPCRHHSLFHFEMHICLICGLLILVSHPQTSRPHVLCHTYAHHPCAQCTCAYLYTLESYMESTCITLRECHDVHDAHLLFDPRVCCGMSWCYDAHLLFDSRVSLARMS